MSFSYDHPAHRLNSNFLALIVIVGCIVTADTPRQMVCVVIASLTASPFFSAFLARALVIINYFSLLMSEKENLNDFNNASTVSQAEDDYFHDTFEVPLKTPPRPNRYSTCATPTSGNKTTQARWYSTDATPISTNKTTRAPRSGFQSPKAFSSKKQARDAAIRRAKLAMHDDKQKVDAVKRKKERDETFKRAY